MLLMGSHFDDWKIKK